VRALAFASGYSARSVAVTWQPGLAIHLVSDRIARLISGRPKGAGSRCGAGCSCPYHLVYSSGVSNRRSADRSITRTSTETAFAASAPDAPCGKHRNTTSADFSGASATGSRSIPSTFSLELSDVANTILTLG